MSYKVISIGLNAKDINRAIREVNKFKQDFKEKVDTYRKRIAEEIAVNAQSIFNSSVINDVVMGGSPHSADVVVSVREDGNITVIVAEGEDAVWCEFGAGVYHNGSAGSSPNPFSENVVDVDVTIGSYGKGYGKRTAWGYYPDGDTTQEVVITRGTKATMPMYNAAQEVARRAVQIAKEVFR